MLWLFVTHRTRGVFKFFSLFTPESTHVTAWSTIGKSGIWIVVNQRFSLVQITSQWQHVDIAVGVSVLHYLNRWSHMYRKASSQGWTLELILTPAILSSVEVCGNVVVTHMDSKTVGHCSYTVLFKQTWHCTHTFLMPSYCDWLFPLFIKQCFRPEITSTLAQNVYELGSTNVSVSTGVHSLLMLCQTFLNKKGRRCLLCFNYCLLCYNSRHMYL